jgi:hypothetical protein
MADVIMAAILSHDAGGTAESDTAARLQRLGKYLRDLGSLTIDDFETFVGSARQLQNLAATAALEACLREHGAAPDFWADDVRRTIDALRKTAARSDYMVPRDLRGGRDLTSARMLAQELVVKFGALLEAWPTLVETTRRLRAIGCRVSARVD